MAHGIGRLTVCCNKFKKYLFHKLFSKEIAELPKRIEVSSYTQIGRDKKLHESIISDEYWTEHINLDGSILKVQVKPI